MKARIISLILGLLILCTLTALAQSKKAQSIRWPAKSGDVEEVKERTLLVALTGYPNVDENIKKIFPRVWDFSEVKFVPVQDIPSTIDGNEKKYAIMSVNIITVKQTGSIIPRSSRFMRFAVRLAEKYKKRKSIYYQDVFFTEEEEGNLKLGQREVFVATYNILNHYEAKMNDLGLIEAIKLNAGQLENKTLLLDKDFLEEGMTKDKIASYYPYPFQIVETATIEKALMDRNEKYAFVELVPVGTSTNMMMHEIYNCEDGHILSTGEFFNGAFDRYSNFINKDHLKAYVKNNERYNKMAENR